MKGDNVGGGCHDIFLVSDAKTSTYLKKHYLKYFIYLYFFGTDFAVNFYRILCT